MAAAAQVAVAETAALARVAGCVRKLHRSWRRGGGDAAMRGSNGGGEAAMSSLRTRREASRTRAGFVPCTGRSLEKYGSSTHAMLVYRPLPSFVSTPCERSHHTLVSTAGVCSGARPQRTQPAGSTLDILEKHRPSALLLQTPLARGRHF